MAKQDDYVRYTIRVPAHLYEQLQKAAGEKSVNAEVVSRLDRSFYEPTELNFLEHMASTGFVEPLPPGLARRIQFTAEVHGRSVEEEVIQALENAFPAFSLDHFQREWIDRILSASDEDRPALIRQANEVLEANGDTYFVRIVAHDTGDGSGTVNLSRRLKLKGTEPSLQKGKPVILDPDKKLGLPPKNLK